MLAAGAGRSTAVGACLLPVIEADGMWATGGAKSFGLWVAAEHDLSVQTARAQVRLGRTLRDHLPLTAAAALEGRITVEQARVLATLAPTTEQRRQVLADPEHPCNEAFLVDHAQHIGVDDLRLVTRRWAAYTDPDADDRGYVEACDRAHLEVVRLGDMYDVRGQLTVHDGQAVKAALAAVTPPRAPDDERSAAQRRATALVDLAQLALDRVGGRQGPHRPPPDQRPRRLPDLRGAAHLRAGREGTQGALDTSTGERRQAAGAGRGVGSGAGRGPVCRPSFATPGIVTGSAVAGGRSTRTAPPSAAPPWTWSPATAASPGSSSAPNSEVLDVGRAQRTFTGPRRDALIARDKHCRYPGCTAPPILCDGHHVDQWARDHGHTTVRRGVLLCTFHHQHVHNRAIHIDHRRGGWTFTDRHGRPITGDHDRRLVRRM